MNFEVLTLFPSLIRNIAGESIVGRAQKAGIIKVSAHNIRDYSADRHRKADDTPYGGGMGMLMTAQPVTDCYNDIKSKLSGSTRCIYMSPKGSIFCHEKAKELSKYDNLILLCGHYEGIDQRALDMIVDEEISIGNYVLTGGELAASVIIDAVSRLIPGVLSDAECYEDESVASGLLEYPQYTKPASFMGREVPKVLLGGNHADIMRWRRKKALEITLKHRPDLLETAQLSKSDILYLEYIENSLQKEE